MRRAIEADGLSLGVDRSSALAVFARRGGYERCSVTQLRIFEAAWMRASACEPIPQTSVLDDRAQPDGAVSARCRPNGNHGGLVVRSLRRAV